MYDNKPLLLGISRLLTPEHKADLLVWVRLAHVAENSVKKSLGFDVLTDNPSPNSQGNNCDNFF